MKYSIVAVGDLKDNDIFYTLEKNSLIQHKHNGFYDVFYSNGQHIVNAGTEAIVRGFIPSHLDRVEGEIRHFANTDIVLVECE